MDRNSFDWMRSRVPDGWRARWADNARVSARREIRERAALLMRLGRSRDEAIARCRQNLLWDYQLHGQPPLLGEVEALVNEVYGRTLTLDPATDRSHTRGAR